MLQYSIVYYTVLTVLLDLGLKMSTSGYSSTFMGSYNFFHLRTFRNVLKL